MSLKPEEMTCRLSIGYMQSGRGPRGEHLPEQRGATGKAWAKRELVADTAAAIKNGGVAAAQAGVGFETLNAAIQVLAEREVKGGEAGTALRNVILNLEKGPGFLW
ncbi:phage tail tape measure protein [Citrobacter freundii]|uniref:phage tail tape measure protein n=1 Tax=Citrobacter freundii TaxID=546 RepID=UPI002A35ABD2|nr:phage tail tape measure protein [Citrobacter freundii]